MSFGRRSRFASRAGFTLVELLVVISIIGMLMALLFPAINAARESGRQNTCRNNIRSIGQGLAQYESAKNVFPQISTTKPGTSGNVTLPLLHELFPYMDRMDLFRAYNGVGYGSATDPYIEYMQCPSNPKGDVGSVNNFVFNVGTVEANSSNPLHDGGTSSGGAIGYSDQNNKTSVPEKYAAMFFEVGQTSTSELVDGDGTTNTLMISENLDAGNWTTLQENRIGFIWKLDSSGNPSPSDAGINQRKGMASFDSSDPSSDVGLWAPTSNHPMLVNVGFADGHVRTLNDAISYHVYAQLCTPRGSAFGMNVLTSGY